MINFLSPPWRKGYLNAIDFNFAVNHDIEWQTSLAVN